MMTCDLDRIFAPTAARLPDTDESRFVFAVNTLPQPPAVMVSDRLVIEKTYHAYDADFRCDALHFYATKGTYCQLALLIAAVLFSDDPVEVTLRLDHPASGIRRVVVRRYAATLANTPGFHSRPLALNYYPNAVDKHPWEGFRGDPVDLPGFFLTNDRECLTTDAEWALRDTVVGFGGDVGVARLIVLLLDASRSASRTLEFELEGEGGFRGVAPHSCEVRLWLPGSFGWRHDLWAEDTNGRP